MRSPQYLSPDKVLTRSVAYVSVTSHFTFCLTHRVLTAKIVINSFYALTLTWLCLENNEMNRAGTQAYLFGGLMMEHRWGTLKLFGMVQPTCFYPTTSPKAEVKYQSRAYSRSSAVRVLLGIMARRLRLRCHRSKSTLCGLQSVVSILFYWIAGKTFVSVSHSVFFFSFIYTDLDPSLWYHADFL